MFKKHIFNIRYFNIFNIFQMLYIIVGPLSNALFSTKSLLPTSTVCSDWPTDPEHCDWPNTTSMSRKCSSPYLNFFRALALPLPFKINVKTVNNVFSFTISSSPRGEQSRVTDTVMKLVCFCKQAAIVWPCLPFSRTQAHTHTHTHTHTYNAQNSAFKQSIANTYN